MENKESRCESCIVRQLNALDVLSKSDLKKLSDNKEVHTFRKGQSIFDEGEHLKGVFCVRSGVSKLSKMSPKGKDHVVKLAKRGEVLGQRSVITDERTNLSAVAVNDMEVCFIPKRHILSSIDTNIEFTKKILIRIANDLKFADDSMVDLAQKTISQRLSHTLIYLEENFGVTQEGAIGLQLSREDLANIIGSAKEACIRTLATFKKNGWIETQGKSIIITNKKALLQDSECF